LDAEPVQAPSRGVAGRRALAAITLAVTALAPAACSSPAPLALGSSPAAAASAEAVTPPTAPAATTQALSETGSSLMAPLFARWGPAYHARFSQVTLRTTSSSSGTGIGSAAAGTADIGASDAYLSPATLAKHPHLVNIALAVAALMVVYNVPGIRPATHLELDGKLLARIYGGQITAWDDPAIAAVNPGVKLPGTSIVLVHRGDDSAGEGEAALGNSAGSYVLPAAGTIQAALASFTNTPASETISLVNGSGARAYPIVNYEYAIVSTVQGSAVRARDLRAFLSWAITSGAAQLAPVNFQPLPSSVVTLSGTQIAKIEG
jgi:ABC-type phosphate transport system substrate-binding protein